MKKILLTAAIASLFAAQAFAQTSAPGEDKASASKPASSAEKAAAKHHRKTAGTEATKEAKTGDAQPNANGTAKVSKEEKAAARKKRKAAGAEATKAKKDQTTGAGGN